MSRILIGLAAVWLFAGGFGSVESAACGNDGAPQRECKPCKRPDGTLNHAPNVTDLLLDRNEIPLNPASPGQPASDSPPKMLINVATTAVDGENDVLTYYYTVSAGRIFGSGSSVTWDLSGVSAGNYTITAKVDDSCGVCGTTKTKLIRVIGKTAPAMVPTVVAAPAVAAPRSVSIRPAASAPTLAKTSVSALAAAPASVPAKACACPKISLADPEKSGSDLIFTTRIDGLLSNQLSFIWTVIGGKVVSQDKGSIRINPGNLAIGGSVNVVVNGLEPRCNCPNQARKTF
ncbi:MAG TPA: hypothetical protein VEV84_10870 [Pyrinomonadaceae bacterium]|nr:hypothetical protein [Pyrinomonadaceae bacterium]